MTSLEDARRLRISLRFDGFELEARTFELRRGGRRIALAPQPYDLLWLLASRAGALVGRDEIRRALWGEGTFVEFDACTNYSIRALRKALGDDVKDTRYIEAVRGRGYRFVAPVEIVAGP